MSRPFLIFVATFALVATALCIVVAARRKGPPPGITNCLEIPSHGCMVEVAGGRFLMGAQSANANAPGYDPVAEPDEGPPREVHVDSFWMHQLEVFADSYGRCVQAGGCSRDEVRTGGGYFHEHDLGNRSGPLNGVTWKGADTYCRWIGARLPTEAEWEYAARGGSLQARWSGSLTRPGCHVAIAWNGCGRGRPSPNSELSEPFVIAGLAGNVWEWTADWYAPDAYASMAATNPTGPATGTARVQRGGGWMTEDENELRAAARASLDPSLKLDDVGFRCVAEPASDLERLLGLAPRPAAAALPTPP